MPTAPNARPTTPIVSCVENGRTSIASPALCLSYMPAFVSEE
jgi:hypothetical protein